MRIGGIASGIDTEQMIKQLMNAERMRVNRFLRQEQTLKWRMESYNNVNKSMANFILNTRKEFGLNDISTNGTIRSGATNSFTWVKQANSTNNAVVSATARADAMNGSYTVKVEQLADVARLTSEGSLKGTVLDDDLKFINGGSFKISTHTGEEVIIDVNPVDGEPKNIHNFVKQINDAGGALGIRAAYDKDLDQLLIVSRATGEKSHIKITEIDGASQGYEDPNEPGEFITLASAIFGAVNINETDTGDVKHQGVQSRILYNGETIEKDTNNFTIYGVDFNLKATSPEEIKINVHTNVDGIYDKIKSFVDSYNALIDEMNGKVNEKHYRDYAPLTQEEKDSMSDKEIELWEEKARSGLLRNDEVINRTLQSIRSNLYEKVEGVTGSFERITDLGITTGFYKDGGKLVIDENKLRAAINTDPDGVLDMFFKAPETSSTGKDRMEQSGILQRAYDGLVTGMKEIIRHSGTGEDAGVYRSIQSNMLIDFVSKHSSISVIDRDLNQLNLRIANEERLLARREDSYWKQFTAMEKAMASMQQQSMWLMSQMGIGA
ncbi:flagellar filament capping protein FliD [Alkaliphilus peptidifermentans]|uniref:Flagellar hook-associated protein 2 n=1 Tax=Alkaliphilus peptidifermentans DSM 18978 TaxID=1120976 RepID=A0A1G5JDQ7_9FIRM|nr:flagellar filament capping protein FliD [Alkaliphilus peptidifermentans]SCY86397.1 flagellar hook-associated protein 2 [Alkaliphilus peptidifermentans DSM 18978]